MPELFRAYAVNQQSAAASYALMSTTLHEQGQLLESLRPERGDPSYSIKYAAFLNAQNQAATIANAIKKGQCGLYPLWTAISRTRHKPVSSAYEAMRKGMSLETTAAYAKAMDAQQDRLGIPPNQRNLIPGDYASTIAAQVEARIKTATNPEQAAGVLNAYRQAWGPLWSRIYPDLGEKLSPTAMVATSGVEPHVAQTLLSVANQSSAELSKNLPRTDNKTRDDRIVSNLADLNSSMGASPGGEKTVNVFGEQMRKLAAVYQAQGTDASGAADRAYKELIGNRYEFTTSGAFNVRVPKAEYFDGLERELRRARDNLGAQNPRLGVQDRDLVPNPFDGTQSDRPAPPPMST